MQYEIIIGLEIHIQLRTQSKMFCSCRNVLGEAEPNTSVCPVCMGHPGTLPVLNQEAVLQGIRLARALDAGITPVTRFDRKNYFYPDLPKGYQISQFDKPLATGGRVSVLVGESEKVFELERLHLEEDAAKNFHKGDKSYVDFNRAGAPLAEIVTLPDFRDPLEAKLFLQELRLIARYLGVSDADMEKGQLRCDANISLRPIGEDKLYPKTEVKNLNSFKSVERALVYEAKRQEDLWEKGKAPTGQETRGWDEKKQETVPQRTKEGLADYRYFPEPDLPPLHIDRKTIEQIERERPEMPAQKRERFAREYGLMPSEAQLLIGVRSNADFFEQVVEELKSHIFDSVAKPSDDRDAVWEQHKKRLVKLAYNWYTSELFKHLKGDGAAITDSPITQENMAELLVLMYEGKINSSAGQTILDIMYHNGGDPSDIANEQGLFQVSDDEDIRKVATEIIAENQEQVQQYLKGKTAVLQFLVGKVMQRSKGSANPQVAAKLLEEELNKLK